MRGKVIRRLDGIKPHRITPAYAGKSFVYKSEVQYNEDHPRLCGEKSHSIPFHSCQRGSPPPMRGKVRRFRKTDKVSGITPAYAGKSRLACRQKTLHEDHPRLCGEKQKASGHQSRGKGSPPPMRGKATSCGIADTRPGITPAYAGKSVFLSTSRAFCKDHPRLCGEKINFRMQLSAFPGSPPPMRGKEHKG